MCCCVCEVAMASSLAKLCFNSSCNQLLGEHSRRGWRRRTGEFADLCDRCAYVFFSRFFPLLFHVNSVVSNFLYLCVVVWFQYEL